MIRCIRHLLWKATLVRMYDMRRRWRYVQRISLAAASASAEEHLAWHYTTDRCNGARYMAVLDWRWGRSIDKPVAVTYILALPTQKPL